MHSIYTHISSRLAKLSASKEKLPKYRQLSEAILAMIDDADLKPGDRLPTESALTEKLPFSLGTIQKALRSLSELGAIRRTRRRGTVVSNRTSKMQDLWQFRFINEDENSVYPVFSRIIKMDRTDEKGPWNRFLGEGESIVRIVREIDVNRQFKAHSSFYLSFDRYGKILELSQGELEGVHLSAVIQRMFGVTTIHTSNRLVGSVIPDPVCLRLGLPSGASGLICEIFGFGQGNKPLSYQHAYIPADAPPLEFREQKPA